MQVKRSIICNADAIVALEVVKNVAKYPDFLPFVSTVTERTNETATASQANISSYDIIITGMGLKYKFSGSVIVSAERSLDLRQLQGPFSKFMGQWTIEKIQPAQCSITISCEFQFKALSHMLVFKAAKNKIFSQLEHNFKQRIEMTYREKLIYQNHNE